MTHGPGDPDGPSVVPARLRTGAAPQQIDPPVETRLQLLPFGELTWQNFERLCLRLASARGTVDHAVDHARGDVATGGMSARTAQTQGRLYGVHGESQQGIDLYVRLPVPLVEEREPEPRRYLSLQSRRIATLDVSGLRRAVADFLSGRWAAVSRTFVYATSLPAVRTKFADEIERQAVKLGRRGVDFQVWDAEELSERLRDDPKLVDEFFGRAWVNAFCGPWMANALGRQQLDAGQHGARRRLMEAPVGQPVREVADQLAVEVHQAIQAGPAFAGPRSLPVYVPRAHDARLRKLLLPAPRRSAFVMLVGGAAAGKTRTCLEVVQSLPDHWRLWRPTVADQPEMLLDMLAADSVAPFTVFWLNEAQRFLELRGGERIAATLQALLNDANRAPVLILGTLRPERWRVLTAPDVHPQASALLEQATEAGPRHSTELAG